jgi:hypothetical protein
MRIELTHDSRYAATIGMGADDSEVETVSAGSFASLESCLEFFGQVSVERGLDHVTLKLMTLLP